MYEYKAIVVNGKKIDEHRWIMGNIIGRKLSSQEIVHHKNGNKRDNEPENLALTSLPAHSRYHMRGENAPCAKLTEEQVKEIFNSKLGCRRLARIYKVDRKAIQKIRNGKNWKHLNLKKTNI